MSEQKIYVGSGKKTSQYDIVNVSVCISDLPKEHIFEYNGKKYIKLVVAAKKETDQYGKTHYVAIDTWKPEQQETQSKTESKTESLQAQDDDLPW